MTQTKLASLIETIFNVAVGFVVSVILTAVVFPLYGHAVPLSQNIQITGIFTVTSVLRGYGLRRLFNARMHAAAQRMASNFKKG